MTLQIGLATPDDVYAKRFIAAASSGSSEQSMFHMIAFTKEEALDKYMSENKSCDVLLLSPSFAWKESWQAHHANMHVIYLSEVPVPNEIGADHLSPYQPASAILHQLAARAATNKVHREHHAGQNILIKRLQRLKVDAVFSAAGGSGKTTTALQWARRCSNRGEKLLYLNLECPSGSEAWLSNGENLLWEELLYFVKEKSERLHTKLSSYLLRDAVWNFSYLPSVPSVDPSKHLHAEDMAFLLQIIEENGSTDRVVIDAGYSSLELIEAVFMHAERVLWIVTEDLMAQEKEKQMFTEMKKLGWLKKEGPAVHFILNRRLSQSSVPDWTGATGESKRSAWLPYVPDWKMLQQKSDWDPPAQYVYQMDHLLEQTEKEGMRYRASV